MLIGLLQTGARYREIARMNWGSVDLDGRKLRIHRQKGGIDGTLVMSDQLHAMLQRRKSQAADQWVFPTKRRHNNNYAWLRSALERAGINEDAGKITLHKARHTFAAAHLADYGFNCLRLSDDWQGADFIACHIDGNKFLKGATQGPFEHRHEVQRQGHLHRVL